MLISNFKNIYYKKNAMFYRYQTIFNYFNKIFHQPKKKILKKNSFSNINNHLQYYSIIENNFSNSLNIQNSDFLSSQISFTPNDNTNSIFNNNSIINKEFSNILEIYDFIEFIKDGFKGIGWIIKFVGKNENDNGISLYDGDNIHHS